MGSALSLGGTDTTYNSVSSGHEPLPDPCVIDSTTPMMLNGLNLVPRSQPPVNVKTTKRSIPFMIDRNSLTVIGFDTSSAELVFAYRSDVAVDVSLNVHSEGVSRFSRRLPPSSTMTKCTINMPVSSEKLELRLFDTGHVLIASITSGKTPSVETLRFTWNEDGACVDILGLYIGSESTCVICYSATATVGFLPCRHVCVCQSCSTVTLSSTDNHCPLCRATVTGRIAI